MARTAVHRSPVWSADGRRLYYVSNREGPSDIYSIEISDQGTTRGDPVRATTGLDVYSIAFTADRRTLAYAASTRRAPTSGRCRSPPTGCGSVSRTTPRPAAHRRSRRCASRATAGGCSTTRSPRHVRYLPHPARRRRRRAADRRSRRRVRPGPLDRWSLSRVSLLAQRVARHLRAAAGPFHRLAGDRDVLSGEFPGVVAGRRCHRVSRSVRGGWCRAWRFSRPAGPVGRLGSAQAPPLPARRGCHGRRMGGFSPTRIGAPLKSCSWIPRPRVVFAPDVEKRDQSRSRCRLALDGRTLYFKSHDERGRASLWSVPVRGGTPTLLVRLDDPARPSSRTDFAVGDDRLYFAVDDRRCNIWVTDVGSVTSGLGDERKSDRG